MTEREQLYQDYQWKDLALHCQQAVKEAPSPEVWHDYAVALHRLQKRHEAVVAAEKSLQLYTQIKAKENPEGCIAALKSQAVPARYLRSLEILGESWYEQGFMPGVWAAFHYLKEFSGEFPRKHLYLFKAHLHLKNHSEAHRAWQAMMVEFPDQVSPMETMFRDYLKRHPEQTRAQLLLARILHQSGRLQAEISQRVQSIDEEADILHHLTFLLGVMERSDDIDGLSLIYERLSQLQPDQEQWYLKLGRCRGRQGDLGLALDAWSRLLFRDPDQLSAVVSLAGEVLESQKDMAQASQEMAAGIHEKLGGTPVGEEFLSAMQKKFPEATAFCAPTTSTTLGSMTMMLEKLDLRALAKMKERIESELEDAMRVVSIMALDIVDSKLLKKDQDRSKVMLTFEDFHSHVELLLKQSGAQHFSTVGDGKIFLFDEADEAITAACRLMESLVEFNHQKNRLSQDVQLRIGIHSGPFLRQENKNSDRVADETLDHACHLEKYGHPGEIHISEACRQAIHDPERAPFSHQMEKGGHKVYKVAYRSRTAAAEKERREEKGES